MSLFPLRFCGLCLQLWESVLKFIYVWFLVFFLQASRSVLILMSYNEEFKAVWLRAWFLILLSVLSQDCGYWGKIPLQKEKNLLRHLEQFLWCGGSCELIIWLYNFSEIIEMSDILSEYVLGGCWRSTDVLVQLQCNSLLKCLCLR